MDNVERWFDENSRKIMDFSDTNEEVISKEKFLEFAERQASKISSNVPVIKSVCDVCGSDDVIEVTHMGKNCNRCHPL